MPGEKMNDYRDNADTELIEMINKKGYVPHDIFEEIVYRYKDHVYMLALKKLNNQVDAQDATQEVFIRAYHGLLKFRQDSSLKTWLSVIAGNVCLSIMLTEKNKLWKYHVSLDGDTDVENIYNSIFSQKQEILFWKRVGEILRKMYTDYRKIFILKYFKNYSLKLLAIKVHSTFTAIKMKVKRAKDQFVTIFMRG